MTKEGYQTAFICKQLDSSDAALMKQLLNVFGDAFEDVSTYQDSIPSEEYLSSLLAQPSFIALVALEQEEVIGGIAAYVLEKFEQNRREIYIYDLAVAESHRRKGVATQLIRQLQQLARQMGAYLIFVQADEVDEPAIQLYKRFGTRENVLQFDIPV